jgi:hypothetical protein
MRLQVRMTRDRGTTNAAFLQRSSPSRRQGGITLQAEGAHTSSPLLRILESEFSCVGFLVCMSNPLLVPPSQLKRFRRRTGIELGPVIEKQA